MRRTRPSSSTSGEGYNQSEQLPDRLHILLLGPVALFDNLHLHFEHSIDVVSCLHSTYLYAQGQRCCRALEGGPACCSCSTALRQGQTPEGDHDISKPRNRSSTLAQSTELYHDSETEKEATNLPKQCVNPSLIATMCVLVSNTSLTLQNAYAVNPSLLTTLSVLTCTSC